MNPANSQLINELREPIYDTYSAAHGAALPTRIVMFATPQGATVGPEITSMTKAGELPNPERMEVYTVIVESFNSAKADVIGFVMNYALKITVSGKPQLTTPFTVRGDFDDFANLAYVRLLQVELPEELKIVIEQGQPFTVELVSRTGYTLTDAALGLFLRVKLDGIHTVPIG